MNNRYRKPSKLKAIGEGGLIGLGCLGVILLCVAFALLPTLIVWAAWNFVIVTIWATLPVLAFWKVWLVCMAISIICGAFRTKVTVTKS